jgi:sugar phosphate isomerase/epimerase
MDQIIDVAVKNGYTGVELRAVAGTVDLWSLPDFQGVGLRETAGKLRGNGLEIVCIGSNIRFSEGGEARKEEQLETARVYLEILNALDCRYLRTFGGPLTPTMGYLESIECIQDGYESLCDLTAKAGVMPLLETHDDFSTSARVRDILDGVSSDNLGVVWDVLHPLRFGEGIAATYGALKERIRHVHVKDSLDFSPRGFDLVLTGRGKVPLDQVTAILKAGGYDGFLSFEWEKMWHPEIEEPEVALPDYVEAMKVYL